MFANSRTTTECCPHQLRGNRSFTAFEGPVARDLIGANHKLFHVHKDILCSASSYFKAALNGIFVEAAQQECVLDDVEHHIFGLLLRICYADGMSDKAIMQELTGQDVPTLCRLWILADRFGMPSIQDAIVDTLCDQYENSRSPLSLGNESATIWDSIPPESKLRLLILDTHNNHITSVEDVRKANLCQGLILDLTDAKVAADLQPWIGKTQCRYHVHSQRNAFRATPSIWSRHAGMEPAATRTVTFGDLNAIAVMDSDE